MEKPATLEQTAISPDSIRLAKKANLTGGLLIGRMEIKGPEHIIPIPTGPRATKLGRKGGYALFYDGMPNGYNTERRGELKNIPQDAVSVQFPGYDVYNGHSSSFITYGKPVFHH